MITDLKGKTVLVTGAADGIGKTIAVKLATCGANVVVTDYNVEKAQQVADQIKAMGVKAIAVKMDLYDYDAVVAATNKAIAAMGNIELLVACGAANAQYAKPAYTFDPKVDFDGNQKVHVWARLYPIYALHEHMKANGYGKVVVITSDAGRTPTPKEAFVGGAASMLITIGKVMGKENARYGIRHNTVCLTLIENTPAQKQVETETQAANIFAKVRQRASFGIPQVEDVSEIVTYFVSPESDKITGSVFSVNGALSFPG
jgi:3-oxoacyl-[acyl-carrier protein] reductase